MANASFDSRFRHVFRCGDVVYAVKNVHHAQPVKDHLGMVRGRVCVDHLAARQLVQGIGQRRMGIYLGQIHGCHFIVISYRIQPVMKHEAP